MTALKSLTFTTLPSQSGNPILDRRAKIIARLEEQKLVLKDPNYTRTNRKWVKKDGERVMVEQQQRVPLSWRQHPNGSYALFVRSGLKPIEFEKGNMQTECLWFESRSGGHHVSTFWSELSRVGQKVRVKAERRTVLPLVSRASLVSITS